MVANLVHLHVHRRVQDTVERPAAPQHEVAVVGHGRTLVAVVNIARRPVVELVAGEVLRLRDEGDRVNRAQTAQRAVVLRFFARGLNLLVDVRVHAHRSRAIHRPQLHRPMHDRARRHHRSTLAPNRVLPRRRTRRRPAHEHVDSSIRCIDVSDVERRIRPLPQLLTVVAHHGFGDSVVHVVHHHQRLVVRDEPVRGARLDGVAQRVRSCVGSDPGGNRLGMRLPLERLLDRPRLQQIRRLTVRYHWRCVVFGRQGEVDGLVVFHGHAYVVRCRGSATLPGIARIRVVRQIEAGRRTPIGYCRRGRDVHASAGGHARLRDVRSDGHVVLHIHRIQVHRPRANRIGSQQVGNRLRSLRGAVLVTRHVENVVPFMLGHLIRSDGRLVNPPQEPIPVTLHLSIRGRSVLAERTGRSTQCTPQIVLLDLVRPPIRVHVVLAAICPIHIIRSKIFFLLLEHGRLVLALNVGKGSANLIEPYFRGNMRFVNVRRCSEMSPCLPLCSFVQPKARTAVSNWLAHVATVALSRPEAKRVVTTTRSEFNRMR